MPSLADLDKLPHRLRLIGISGVGAAADDEGIAHMQFLRVSHGAEIRTLPAAQSSIPGSPSEPCIEYIDLVRTLELRATAAAAPETDVMVPDHHVRDVPNGNWIVSTKLPSAPNPGEPHFDAHITYMINWSAISITTSRDPLGTLATFNSLRRLSMGPSVHGANKSVLPDTQLPFQYELMMRHPQAFPVVRPLTHAEGDISTLRPSPKTTVNPHPLASDHRFAQLRTDRWTEVQLPRGDAIRLIMYFLENDHPVLGFFDAELFVHDLVTGCREFCSSFLVNCVLYWSCISCSSTDELALSLKSEFFRAANALWQDVRSVDDVSTVAGSQIFCLACSCEGYDVLAEDLKHAGYEMAIRLGLLGCPSMQQAASHESEKQHRSRCHTAWGVYNWLSFHTFYYKQTPVADPPKLPIPSDKWKSFRDDVSSLFGISQTFISLCKFCSILRPIMDFFAPGSHEFPLHHRMTVATVERAFHDLLSWADENINDSAKVDAVDQPHHALLMQIWFHTAIMEIFRPFYGRHVSLNTFDTRHSTPEIVFWSSLTQLEHLVLEYRQSHPSAQNSMLWHVALLFIANSIIRQPTGSNWRFNLLLCMYSYIDLAGSFRLANGFLRSILYMALVRKVVSTGDAQEIMSKLPRDNPVGADAVAQRPRVGSGHIVDLDLAVDDPSVSQVSDLAEKLDDVLMFDAFVLLDENQGESTPSLKKFHSPINLTPRSDRRLCQPTRLSHSRQKQ
ncbi:hypothetical protein Q7P37_010426 [Cladosporium fusiforme]